MIRLVIPPPLSYGLYYLRGFQFIWEPDEPFVSYMLDGTVDVDLTRQTPGFINRIQRFGIQNNFPRSEWDEQTILFSLLQRIPLELRGKYFRNESGSQVNSTYPRMPAIHSAPVPAGLAKAANLGDVADDHPDVPARLAAQTPEQWLATLKRWLAADPGRKTKTVAGPAWWYAIHTVALNPVQNMNPLRFVGQWKGTFPCRLCRLGTSAYIAAHPVPGWEHFPEWASKIHDYVTAKKK